MDGSESLRVGSSLLAEEVVEGVSAYGGVLVRTWGWGSPLSIAQGSGVTVKCDVYEQ